MSTFSFSQSVGDLGSVNSLHKLGEHSRPILYLSCRNTDAGKQASMCGYGIIGTNGIPVITRLYAARIPNTSGAPNILRRNLEKHGGKWISSAVPSAKIFYKGPHPGTECRPGEVFIKITAAIPKDRTVPIYSAQVWDLENMRWRFSKDVIPGIVGLLPINQGPADRGADISAEAIHPALFAAGFVVSAFYEEKFKLVMPEGFPEIDNVEVLQDPSKFVDVLSAWTTAMTNAVPDSNSGNLRQILTNFQRESDADIEKLKAAR